MAVNGAGSGQGSIFRGQGRDGRERVGFGGSELWGVGGWGSGTTGGWGGAEAMNPLVLGRRAGQPSGPTGELEEGGQALALPWAWWTRSWTCTQRCSAFLLEGLC